METVLAAGAKLLTGIFATGLILYVAVAVIAFVASVAYTCGRMRNWLELSLELALLWPIILFMKRR